MMKLAYGVYALNAVVALGGCPPEDFSSVENLDLDSYISSRWYIQQQMETSYLPKTHNWCVYAEYSRLAKKSFWGYDVQVHNHAEEKDGTVHDSNKDIGGSGILAKVLDEKRGQLEVAPYFLPTFLAGPYWVIDYSEQEGYTLVSGGPPSKEGTNGKCRTGTGTNNAGLWIFTRQQKRDEKIIAKVRGIAESKGFDLSVLNDVDHSNCTKSNEENRASAVLI
jgi:lipocalin